WDSRLARAPLLPERRRAPASRARLPSVSWSLLVARRLPRTPAETTWPRRADDRRRGPAAFDLRTSALRGLVGERLQLGVEGAHLGLALGNDLADVGELLAHLGLF